MVVAWYDNEWGYSQRVVDLCFPLSLKTSKPQPKLKVVAWYDNEWGYSQRVVDLCQLMARSLLPKSARAGGDPLEDFCKNNQVFVFFIHFLQRRAPAKAGAQLCASQCSVYTCTCVLTSVLCVLCVLTSPFPKNKQDAEECRVFEA